MVEMSDLCMYELEDNVWDEFGENDDHRVPHPSDEDGDKRAVQGDKQKKGRHGVIEMTDSANDATKYDIPGNEVSMTKNDTMSESDLTINDSSMGGRCLKGDNIDLVGANDPILDDCSLSHVTQTDNGLNFYDNDDEDKQSSDLLYYGWPDIGNFEDVDRMFSCDSTFGMGSLNNGDELCWFSPSHAAEGPEEAVKSGFEFSCPESNLPSVLKNVSEQNAPSVDDSGKKSQSLSDKINSQTTDDDDLADSGCIQVVKEIDAKSENGSQSVHKGQMNLQRKQSKHHGRDRKRKDCYSENSDCFSRSSNLDQFGDVKHPFEDSSKKFHGQQGIHTPSSENFKHADIASPKIAHNRVSGQKPMHQSENEIAGSGEVKGAGVPVNLDSSDLQESTCISFLSEKVSPQATSFRHLQQVMEQLDIRTKLCIRDSLYRLARSAEQRHGYLNPNDGLSNDRDVNGALVADETNKCVRFIDIETNTNPVDRSIAHLLFHRPRDPFVTPTNNASSLKAHAMAQGSLICSSTPEKQIFQDIAACTNGKFPRDDEK